MVRRAKEGALATPNFVLISEIERVSRAAPRRIMSRTIEMTGAPFREHRVSRDSA